MPITHLLEDFTTAAPPESALKIVTEDAWEDQRLASFEQGYSAGWEDAVSAQTEDQSRVTGALARNLEDISFTYHEALTQMMTSLEPLFRSLVEVALPQVMSLSFGNHIVEQLCEMAHEQAAQPAMLVLAPGAGATVQPMLERGFSMPVELTEDPAMEQGRALLRIGGAERQIDCDQLISSIRDAVEAFLFQANKEIEVG